MTESLGTFAHPPADNHPADIADRLMHLPEHSHLKEGEARIAWLMRRYEKKKDGRNVLGTCHLPRVQGGGDLRDVFQWIIEEKFGYLPDFLIVLDEEYWLEANNREREILVYHELCHAVQATDRNGELRFVRETGLPVWAIAGHSVEEFTAVVRRYGAHNPDILAFVEAARAHAADC